MSNENPLTKVLEAQREADASTTSVVGQTDVDTNQAAEASTTTATTTSATTSTTTTTAATKSQVDESGKLNIQYHRYYIHNQNHMNTFKMKKYSTHSTELISTKLISTKLKLISTHLN